MWCVACGTVGLSADRPTHVPPPQISLELPSSAIVTGPRLRKDLAEVVPGAAWKDATLRDALNPLADAHSIAVLRDRRIDPTRTINLSVATVPLRQLLDQIASEADAEVRLVGNCMYVCPQNAAAVVRTLAELRKEELTARSGQQRSQQQQVALQRNQTVRWADLTEASESLRLVTDRFGLSIENSELLPYDLWSGAVFAEMSSPEMLTLLLLQFDLTFEWSDDLRSIRLVPLPDDRSLIIIKRTHRPRDPSQETIAKWRREVGDFQATINGRVVEVAATVEQHEEIERLISGRPATNAAGEPPAAIPLARRQFTLTASGVPTRSIMTQLEGTGITFEFDADALKAAEIDLKTPVSMKVDQADAKAFFAALFGPLKLSTSFSGTTVRLEPVERPR
ncbi:MAG: hypothetical protein H0T47_13850 [Planctomycetaceae bacterium]|nr:hypothetical protein [Planctomycetaceae bacterium]